MQPNLTFKFNAEGELFLSAARKVDNAITGLGQSADVTSAKAKAMGDTAAASFQKTEISAKQTAAAMRNLPAQFTDIFVSLQGGQAPLTVLFQQGGQVADMFGGVGNAARAMGSYVASLVNPFSVAAAAIGAIGIAYYQGSKEADAFRLALINTGNAAGTSASEMAGLAASMGNTFGQTIGQSAEALAALAATGQVGRASLQQFAQTAVDMEKTTGQSIEATAKIFADLGREPVAASAKLNETLNYLTASTYAQIKAAQDLGNTEQAAALAQEAYANAMKGRADTITQNLGYIERGWKAVSAAARESWDFMLGMGRAGAASEQIQEIRKELDFYEKGLRNLSARQVEAYKTQLANLSEVERMQKRAGVAAIERAATEKAGIAAIDAVGKANEAAMTKQERMNKELAAYRKHLQALPAESKQSAEQIAAAEAAIRDKYKDTKKTGGTGMTPGESELAAAKAKVDANTLYLASLREVGAAAEKQTATELALAKVSEELAGKVSGVARANKEALKSALEKQVEQEKAIGSELGLIKFMEESAKLQAKAAEQSDRNLEALKKQAAAEREATASIGLSKDAIAELTAAKYDDSAASKERLADIMAEAGESELLIQKYRAEAAALRELAKAKRKRGNAEAASEAEKAATDAAKKAADEWQRTAEKIESSLTDALMRGFESGKGFAKNLRDTFKNMFSTLVLRPVIQAMVVGATGLGGASANAGGLSGLMGGGSGALGVLDTVKNVYSTITGGFAALGDKVAFAAQDIGAWLVQNTSGALNSAGSSLMSGAGTLGTIGSYAGGALAGIGIGKAISGQYTTGLGKNTLEVGGTALGAIFGGPLGAAIGGAIGGAINRAFGMGAKTVNSEGITGTFGASGASVQSYADWSQKGGYFRSNKSGRDYSAVSSELDQFLDGALVSVTDATKRYASALGLSTSALEGYTKTVEISLKGLDAAGREKAVADAIAGFGNSMAEQLLGTFETTVTKTGSFFKKRTTETSTWIAGPFVRAGETAGQALQRLGTSLTTVNGVLGTLNQSLLATSLAGADAASQLIEVFGGAQALAQSTAAYYQAFYSEAERNAKATEHLTASLATMGMKLPETLQGWRALVEAQDLSTDAGRRQYAALINLAPAFAQVAGAADSLTAKLGKTVSQLVNGLLLDVDKQITASTAAAEAAREAASAYRDASTSLTAAVASIMGAVGDVRQNAEQAYRTTLASARGGDVAAMQALPQLATAMLAQQRNGAANSTQAALQSAKAAVDLAGVGSVADALGVQKDYQAKLYDVNTAALEVLRSTLASGNATVDEIRSLSSTLSNVGQMLLDSNRLTVGAVTSGSGVVQATLLDASGRVVGTLDSNTALNLAGLSGQTSVLSGLSLDQINTLQDSTGVQTDSLAVAEVAANATGGSQALLSAVLAQLQAPDVATQLLGGKIAEGNALLGGKLEQLIAAVNQQTAAQQAEIKRVQDLAKTQKALESAASLATTLQAAVKDAQASLAATSETVAVYLGRGGRWGTGSARYRYDPNPAYAEAQRTAQAAQAAVQAQLEQLDSLRKTIVNLGGVPAFATGGMHAGGLRLVGEDGPELEVTGPARIFNARQTQDILQGTNVPQAVQNRDGQQGDPALRQLVSEQTAEIVNQRAEIRAGAIAVQQLQQQFNRLTRGGQSMPVTGVQNDPLQVEVAA